MTLLATPSSTVVPGDGWQLSEVRFAELRPGATAVDVAGPLWLLVRSGSVDLITPGAQHRLSTGDAVVLHARTPREIVATAPSVLVLADLDPHTPVPSPMVLPGFAERQAGVVALLDACPLSRSQQPGPWTTSYAGLLGAAVHQQRDELSGGDPGSGDELVRAVVAELTRRPADDWGLERMAALVHLSRSALVQRFRHQLCASPAQVLREVRMRRARALLTEGTHSVTEIAFAVGYNSTAAFSRAFTDDHGVSPRSWRREPDVRQPDRGEAQPGQHCG